MNVLLLGMMGAGKSTVGTRLAQVLGYQFIELDTVVLSHTGFTSIAEVYEHRGSLWKECELEISKDMSLDSHQVIACGGGFTDNALNIQYFREHNIAQIIYVHASPKVLAHRVLSGMDQERLARHELDGKMSHLYRTRDHLYRMHADFVVETDEREVKEVVKEIVTKLHHASMIQEHHTGE